MATARDFFHAEDWELRFTDDRLAQLHAYWSRLRGEQPYPSRAEIDPAAIPSLLPCVFLVDVLRGPLDFRYRLVGSEIARMAQRRLTGVLLADALPAPIVAIYRPLYVSVVEQARPLRLYGGFWVRDRDFLDWEAALLPLGPADQPVNMLLGGMVLKQRGARDR